MRRIPSVLLSVPPALAVLAGAAAAQEGWSFEVEPYLWVPDLTGQGSADGSPEVDLDIDFPGQLSAGFPLALRLDAPGGKWSLLLDGLYARWNDDEGSLRTETELGLLEAGFGLPLHGSWDLTAGVRAVELDLDVELGGADTSGSEGWIDPWVGGRGDLALGGKWSLRGLADVGGFGVGSDFTWQAAALLGWGSARWRVELGYRALAVDFDDDELEADLLAHGPILGLAARF